MKLSYKNIFYLLILMTLIVFSGLNCGKKGPPLPPILLIPEKINDLTAHQVGEKVQLLFTLPEKNTNGSSPANINKIIVYKKIENEEKVFLEIKEESFNNYMEKKMFLLFDSDISDEILKAKKSIKYYVKVFSKKGKSSGVSNIVSVKLNEALMVPESIKYKIRENAIEINWEYKQYEKDGIYFNIYKGAEKDFKPIKPLNPQLIDKKTYEDKEVQEGKAYYYTVRAVKKDENQESEDSQIIMAEYVDTFPPSPPSDLVAVPSEKKIILHWQPIEAPDLNGYKIYRKSSEEASFQLITSQPLKDTSYEDKEVQPNMEYEYYITAIDKASKPNESLPSKSVRIKLSSH